MNRSFDPIKQTLAEPKQEVGTPIPLFERLLDLDPEESEEHPPKKYYSYEEVVLSIEREINRILNTRSTAKDDHYHDLMSDPDNRGLPELFGVPDFSHFDAADKNSWEDIGNICARVIEYYEPRLQKIVVELTGFEKEKQNLTAQVRAHLKLEHYKGEVSFPTIISL